MAQIQKPLVDIIENQQIIYNYLQESFANINQSINKLSNTSTQTDTKVIDEKEQKRLQLQAQIEELQSEMVNL